MNRGRLGRARKILQQNQVRLYKYRALHPELARFAEEAFLQSLDYVWAEQELYRITTGREP